jgi:hypothetical protein
MRFGIIRRLDYLPLFAPPQKTLETAKIAMCAKRIQNALSNFLGVLGSLGDLGGSNLTRRFRSRGSQKVR